MTFATVRGVLIWAAICASAVPAGAGPPMLRSDVAIVLKIQQLLSPDMTLDDPDRQGQAMLANLREDFDAFATDEHHFREVIEASLAERVSYLEDFIREKRKSLQI